MKNALHLDTYLGFQLEMDRLFGIVQKSLLDVGKSSGMESEAEELIVKCMALNDEIVKRAKAFYGKRV